MYKKEAINTVKELLIEAELQEYFSISERTNELADIMVYKGSNGIEQFATDGLPLFPFEMIENILFRRGEGNGCCYNFEGTKLQIVFELKEGASYVLEFGDQGINDMLLTKDRTRILDDKLIHSTLNDYSRQGMIREHVKGLLYIVFESLMGGDDKPNEAVVSEVRKTVWSYIDEHPQDLDFIFFFADEALQLRYLESDIFKAEEIMKRIVECGEEDSFMLYMEEQRYIDAFYLNLVAEALRTIRKIKNASSAES